MSLIVILSSLPIIILCLNWPGRKLSPFFLLSPHLQTFSLFSPPFSFSPTLFINHQIQSVAWMVPAESLVRGLPRISLGSFRRGLIHHTRFFLDSGWRVSSLAAFVGSLGMTLLCLLLVLVSASVATPCSVNAYGFDHLVVARFKVTICDLKSLISCSVSWNMKSFGNLSMLRLTACIRTFVSTPARLLRMTIFV